MANSPGGYAGKDIHLDLSAGTIAKKEMDLGLARKFIGGMGYGAKILYDEVGPEVDPLGPDNVLIYATGPLTATGAPSGARTEVTNKSPLTGIIGSGNTGGAWGATLKRAGFDSIVVRGEAKKPVYLWIDDDHVELRDASHLWGKDSWETADALRKELGESSPHKISVMAIGPSGENLVRYACPVNDYYHVAARGGAGAVMGAKKLKALAVRGTKPVTVSRPEEFKKAVKEARDLIRNHPSYDSMRKLASMIHVKKYQNMGLLPGKNYQTGTVERFIETRGFDSAEKYITKPEGGCYGCPLACFNLGEVNEGKYSGLKVSSATFFSSVCEFGAKCAIDNLPAIWKCKEQCHRFGMDYGSAAGSIAFAMELYQRGILARGDVDGLDLQWGNEDAVLELLDKIAHRQGFGNLLAEGSARAARQIGQGTERYAITIKGLEMMWNDPRASSTGWLFGYMTNPRGGDNIKGTHFRADTYTPDWWIDKYDMFDEVKEKIYAGAAEDFSHTWDGKPMMTKWFEDLCSAINALGVCMFPTTSLVAIGPTHLSKMFSAGTGWDTTPREMMKIGERVFNLMRAYIVREGVTRKDDELPDRFFTDPHRGGPRDGTTLSRVVVDRALDEYYELRGWDKTTGRPTAERLRELDLGSVADDLSRLGS